MNTQDLFDSAEPVPMPPPARKRSKATKEKPALPPLGCGWYGPPPPVWRFLAPFTTDQFYNVAHTAIVDVTDDDSYGRCSLLIRDSVEPVLVAIAAKTVRTAMPWLPSAKAVATLQVIQDDVTVDAAATVQEFIA